MQNALGGPVGRIEPGLRKLPWAVVAQLLGVMEVRRGMRAPKIDALLKQSIPDASYFRSDGIPTIDGVQLVLIGAQRFHSLVPRCAGKSDQHIVDGVPTAQVAESLLGTLALTAWVGIQDDWFDAIFTGIGTKPFQAFIGQHR